MRDPYLEILGDQILAEVSGDDGPSTGFNPDFLINAAAELTKRGVSEYQTREANEKTKKDSAAALARAIAADANWANAEALLDIATQSKDASRIAPAKALQQSAQQAARNAGASLSSDGQNQRISAAQSAADKAATEALGAPSDTLKQARMRAWQKVVTAAMVSNAPASKGGDADIIPSKQHGSGNFLMKAAGPLPVWGWGVVGLTALAGVGVLVKLIRK